MKMPLRLSIRSVQRHFLEKGKIFKQNICLQQDSMQSNTQNFISHWGGGQAHIAHKEEGKCTSQGQTEESILRSGNFTCNLKVFLSDSEGIPRKKTTQFSRGCYL